MKARFMAQAAVWMFASLALTGCMSTTPVWDQHFGESLAHIKLAQTLHPVVTPADESPQSIDAAAAVRAQDQYLHSFEAPPEPKSPDRSYTR